MKKLLCCHALSLLLAAGVASAAPAVVAVYPTASTLPANQLKFYLHFSEPMRQGVFLEHCRLLDERGHEVSEPFRETELWSEDGLRLTLWLHPGRQKTGVNLNTEFGPILAPGGRCTLEISERWPSASGSPLVRKVLKTFFVGPKEAKQLDVREWRITSPTAGSLSPLVIRFPTPLDHALLLRCLSISGADGAPCKGSVSTTDAERCWRFTPEQRWTGQPHRITVASVLEDLAGNSLARPFEVDLEAPAPVKVGASLILPFQPTVGVRSGAQ